MLEIVEVNDIEELSQYRMVWNALFAATPDATFFHTFDWLDLYWRHFGAGQKLRILVVYSASEVVGILPLSVRQEWCGLSKVRVLSYPASEWPTWYGPIGSNPAFTMLAAMQHIRRTPRDWDVLELRGIADDGMQGGKTARGLRAAGLFSEIQEHRQTSVIELPKSVDEFLADKPDYFQRNVHCNWNDLRQKEVVEYIRHRPLPASEGDGDPRWDLYSMCESAGLGRSTPIVKDRMFVDTPGSGYFQASHDAAARLGMLDMNLLLIEGRPAAFAYGYHRHGNITGLQMGASGSNCRELVFAVLLQMLEDSCRRGDRLIDLGPDTNGDTHDLRSRSESTFRITYTPVGSWRSQALRLTRWAKGNLRNRAAKQPSRANSIK